MTSVGLRLPNVCYEDLREDRLKGIWATPVVERLKIDTQLNKWTEFRDFDVRFGMAISKEIGNTSYYKYVIRVLVFTHQIVKSILITKS